MATQRLGDVGNAKLKSRIALGGTNEEEGEIPNNEKIDFAVQRKKARYHRGFVNAGARLQSVKC